MPLVRMLTSWATRRHAFHEGERVQASPEEAQAWLADGIAELVADEPATIPEERVRRPETRRHRPRNGSG